MPALVEYSVRTLSGEPRRWRLLPGMAAGADCVVCGSNSTSSGARLVPVARLVDTKAVLVAHDRPCWAEVQEGRIA